jgi:hypothetical protein
MLRTIVGLGAVASAAAFAPTLGLSRAAAGRPARAVSARGMKMQVAPSQLEKDIPLTPAIFKQLDVDGSGKVDVEELKAIFGSSSSKEIEQLMARADLDGNKELDYAECA